jgi:hypothetical protein
MVRCPSRNKALDAEGTVEYPAFVELSLGCLRESDTEGVGERQEAKAKP